jgi:hypothetical protein
MERQARDRALLQRSGRLEADITLASKGNAAETLHMPFITDNLPEAATVDALQPWMRSSVKFVHSAREHVLRSSGTGSVPSHQNSH